jgi:MATE family multidrug resistance protein
MISEIAVPQVARPNAGSIARAVAAVATPVVLSQVLQTLGGFINALILARVSDQAFAAGMLITSFEMTVITVSFAVVYALSAMFSRVIGEGRNPERIGLLFSAGTVLALVIAAVNMVVLWNVGPILHALKQPEALTGLCERYFRVFVWSLPIMALRSVFSQFVIGIFKQAVVFYWSGVSLLLGAACSFVLTFGKFGLPALGIEGVAWGSMTASMVGFVVLAAYIFAWPEHRVYRLLQFDLTKLRRPMVRILGVGVPICIQMGNELMAFFVTTMMVGRLGVEALAAKQVMTRYLMLLVIPIFGISQASAVLVGREFGAKNFYRAKAYANTCIAVGFVYSFAVLFVFAFAPGPFIRLFLTSSARDELMSVIAKLLVIMAIGQVFDSARNIATGALRGLQSTKIPMLVGIVTMWLLAIPLSYVMGFPLKMGLIGMAAAHSAVMAVSATILVLQWNKVSQRLFSEGAP